MQSTKLSFDYIEDLTVCPSQAGIVSEPLNMGSHKEHCTIAQGH